MRYFSRLNVGSKNPHLSRRQSGKQRNSNRIIQIWWYAYWAGKSGGCMCHLIFANRKKRGPPDDTNHPLYPFSWGASAVTPPVISNLINRSWPSSSDVVVLHNYVKSHMESPAVCKLSRQFASHLKSESFCKIRGHCKLWTVAVRVARKLNWDTLLLKLSELKVTALHRFGRIA